MIIHVHIVASPLIITAPMSVALTGVTDGATLASPANLTITATVSSPVSPVKKVRFYGPKEARLTNTPYSLSVTNLLPGRYYINAEVLNEQGVLAFAYVSFTVTGPAPGNDNFASRTLLTGASATDVSYTGGATTEANEPRHDIYGASANHSIWWEWVAPKSGLVTFTTRGSDTSNVLAIYTGSTLGTLVLERKNNSLGGHKVWIIAAAGTSYKIAVDGPYSTGTIRLSVNQP